MTIQEKIEPSKRYGRASGRITLPRLFRAQVRLYSTYGIEPFIGFLISLLAQENVTVLMLHRSTLYR